MASSSLGLGKGLDALIRETGSSSNGVEQMTALLIDIIPNPEQPRRYFPEKSLEELASSIKNQGLLQPILVKPIEGESAAKYEIIAGERRWRASKLAGLTEIPVVVKNFSLEETLVAALVENLQREDLNPIEEALGIQALKNEFDLSQEDLAQKLGRSRSAIANSLRLLALPPEAQNEVIMGKLSAGHARALLGLESESAQAELREKILNEGLAVREVEALVSLWKEQGSFIPVIKSSLSLDQNIDNTEVSTALDTSLGKDSFNTFTGDHAEIVEEDQFGAVSPEGFDSSLTEEIERTTEEIAPAKTKSRKTSQSRKLFDIQTQLTNVLQAPVKVTGSEEVGKISISFSSKAELEALMAKIAANSIEE